MRTNQLRPVVLKTGLPPIVVLIAIIAALYGWAVVATTPAYPGAIGLNLNTLGTDWMVFWGGARWFFEGHLAGLLDGERFTAWLNTALDFWLSQPIQFRPWVYPPSYLLAMLPFGVLPFAAAYAAFQLLSAALLAVVLWLGAERRQARRVALGAALIGPAAAINVGMGQNAFLTAALLIGGFRLVTARPVLGGAVLGLLTIKPQFWLLVPVALVALRAWRALAASVLAAAALALLSLAVFGAGAWLDWLDLARASYTDPAGRWMELGRMWGESVYTCLVSGGAPQFVANLGQAAAAFGAIAAVYAGCRLPLSPERRIAVLLAATLLAAPHCSLADLVLPATAAALWAGDAADDGAPLAAWTMALAVWLAPLFGPPLISPIARLVPLLILGFIAVAVTTGRPTEINSASLGLWRAGAARPAGE